MWYNLFAANPAKTRLIDALARQVADLSVEELCRLAAGPIAAMTMCEARGYLRARSAGEIRRQAKIVLARHPEASHSWLDEVMQVAAERIVPLALRQIAAGVGFTRFATQPIQQRAA